MMHLNKSVLFHNIFDILFEEYLKNLFSNLYNFEIKYLEDIKT